MKRDKRFQKCEKCERVEEALLDSRLTIINNASACSSDLTARRKASEHPPPRARPALENRARVAGTSPHHRLRRAVLELCRRGAQASRALGRNYTVLVRWHRSLGGGGRTSARRWSLASCASSWARPARESGSGPDVGMDAERRATGMPPFARALCSIGAPHILTQRIAAQIACTHAQWPKASANARTRTACDSCERRPFAGGSQFSMCCENAAQQLASLQCVVVWWSLCSPLPHSMFVCV